MKLGICSAPEYWGKMREIGYHYAEGYFRMLAVAEKDEWARISLLGKEADLPIEVFNGIFARDIPLYGDKETNRIIEDYADRGFWRAKTLGGEITVFGSGAARAIPEGMEKARARERFAEVLRILGDTAKRNGMKLALEPLSYKETNFINTLRDGIEICEYVSHENVGLTLDFFHFYSNGEELSTVSEAKDFLMHAHLARPNPDRKTPKEEDAAICLAWANALRSVNYDQRITMEAVFEKDFIRDAESAYRAMKIFL